MKKFLMSVATLALALTMVSCGGSSSSSKESPKELAEKFIEAHKAGNNEVVKEITNKYDKMSKEDKATFDRITWPYIKERADKYGIELY